MFPLHETTQRWACRVAFALLCVVPTMSLLAYAMWLKTPVHRSLQAEAMSQRTGTVVSLQRLLYPQPRLARMKNVVLEHSQSGEPIAKVRELEIAGDGQRVTLYASQPQLSAGQVDELWRQCERLLLNESFPSAKSMRLIAHDVTIAADNGEAQTLAALDVEFQADGGRRIITAKYQLAGQSTTSLATLRIVHVRGKLAEVHWHTSDGDLPIAVWAGQFPWLKQLGQDCRFRGELIAAQSPVGWSGRLAGTLSNVDLDRLISDTFAHKLSGNAKIIIDEARFDGDRITELRGSIAAGPGVAGSALLADAANEWDLEINGDEAAATLVRYDELAFDFHIDSGRLSLTGTCGDAPSGTMIATGNGQHWRTTADETHNAASLIRILAGESDANVPATNATRELIRWLPLSERSRDQETEKPPQSHLRGL